MQVRSTDHNLLKERLDALYTSFNDTDSATDPIQIVRRYPDPADREVVGFCAAALSFGRVASVLQSIERLVAILGPSPAGFVRAFTPQRHGAAIAPLVHRWTRGEDLIALMVIIRRMLEDGSIQSFFLKGYEPGAPDITSALEHFCDRALTADVRKAAYFFPRPSSGSACKRLNLFLRWMVRKDAVDFGVWSRVPASKLIVPLDTHVIRVGRCLKLTRHTSPGWKMAADITASLRALDPGDPVKYDFSLCHLGMADQCGFNRAQGDAVCPLRGLCHARPRGARRRARGTRPASARPSARR
jgi:uncharacterized protein (TIGR02757 family)